MISRERIIRGLKHPALLGRELNRIYHTRFFTRDFNTSGIDVFDQEWDQLIVLDAARYELFEDKDGISGELDRKESRGSSTVEFMRGNFRGRDLSDVVYVTGNPHLTKLREELDVELHEVIDVWAMEEGWSDMEDTVRPEKVVENAVLASKLYPDKQIIVHFMQPHYPFLYEGEKEIESGIPGIWHKVMRGELDISEQEAWKGYRQTFERVWENVEDLLGFFDGKTVVTSDHGNVYNEKVSPIPVREWGHPIGIYDEKLVKVPWLVVNSDDS
ncbi:MAG: hypothetical protein ABEJ99_04785 [Candidatus Nanohaloarchaea archaeon]